MPNKGKSRLAATDKVLLKYFFWFSLALSVLLLSVRPSVKTAGIVLSVVALGMPLFKNSQAQKETDTVEPGNSPYAIRISGGWWLFLTACAFIMPFAFGWTPGKDPIFFSFSHFLASSLGRAYLLSSSSLLRKEQAPEAKILTPNLPLNAVSFDHLRRKSSALYRPLASL